jgi:hypothetical protein
MSRICIPDFKEDYKMIDARFIGRGAFATCYRDNDTVYSFIKTNGDNSDYSKEAIALFANGKHIPQIEKLGGNVDESGLVFKMPFYNRLNNTNPEAWRQARTLIRIWKRMGYKQQGESGYEYNNRVIEFVRMEAIENDDSTLDEIADDLESIKNACSNYDDTYVFEFAVRNMKVNDDGTLILLDVIFNAKALIELRKKGWL